MNMFKPKGEKPYWEMIYNQIKDKQVGEILTYHELSTIIGEDIRENRSAVYKARKQFLENENKFLDIERNVGYRVVEGMDIMKHAKSRQLIAKHQVVAADFETANINVKTLTPEEKKKLQDFMVHNANIQQAFIARTKAIEMGVMATRENLVGAQAGIASAQVTQLFTEEQLSKLKKLIGE